MCPIGAIIKTLPPSLQQPQPTIIVVNHTQLISNIIECTLNRNREKCSILKIVKVRIDLQLIFSAVLK